MKKRNFRVLFRKSFSPEIFSHESMDFVTMKELEDWLSAFKSAGNILGYKIEDVSVDLL